MKASAAPRSSAAGRAPSPMAASGNGAGGEWLVLTYQLPEKSASLRALVRRKLNAAGAVYLSPACAAAPLSGPAERAMRRMRAAITGAGGSAVLLTGRALAGEPELALVFNAARDAEYADIVAGCCDAVAGLEALAAAREFRYQALWDGDTGLRRLSARYRAVREQDRFGAGRAEAATAALDGYRSVLDAYASRVYAADGRS